MTILKYVLMVLFVLVCIIATVLVARHIIKIKSHAQKGKLVAILRWLYISVAQLKLAVSPEFLQQRDQPFKAIPQLLQLILRKVLKPSHRTL